MRPLLKTLLSLVLVELMGGTLPGLCPDRVAAAEPESPTGARPKKKRKKRPQKDAMPTAERSEEGDEPAAARKESRLIPGTPSRWSNRGAMVPIEAPVPIAAPLPERAQPKPIGVETPGQDLDASTERLSAHLSFSASHLETVRQDGLSFEGPALDLDLFRGRATMDYDRIGGGDIGAHLDLEYRARSSGTRPTDRRVEALYLSYGLTDFRRRDGPDFGAAIGRVVVPEAGFAQADGLALRARLIPQLHLGILGGFTGNPYRYNWRQHTTEDFSTDYLVGGVFAAYGGERLRASVAGVLSYAQTGATGVDRVFAYLDLGWAVSRGIDLFGNAWVDMLPSGQPLQNSELVLSWRPSREIDFRVSAARFSTLRFESSTLYTFPVDQAGATLPVLVGGVEQAPVAVDESGNPIIPMNGVLQSAVYDQLRIRAAVRPKPGMQAYLLLSALIRDPSESPEDLEVPALRVLPTLGGSLHDLVDLSLRGTLVLDRASNADAILRGSIGKELLGFCLELDARAFFGEIGALDGGTTLSYTLPGDLLPGRLMLRGMLRYFREQVTLARPDLTQDILGDDFILPLVPLQESVMGFVGVDWRL